MKTARCSQCPKKFTKPTLGSAEQALRMHVQRVHENMKTWNQLGKPKPGTGPELAVAELLREKPKRKYTKKAVAVTKEIRIDFCPGCGFDQALLAQALAIAQRLKK